jgi:hypothetical protein
LKKAASFIAEAPFSKGLEVRVIHEGRVFHWFAGYWTDHCAGKMLLGPMICSEGNCRVGSIHAPEIMLRQISGGKIL